MLSFDDHRFVNHPEMVENIADRLSKLHVLSLKYPHLKDQLQPHIDKATEDLDKAQHKKI